MALASANVRVVKREGGLDDPDFGPGPLLGLWRS